MDIRSMATVELTEQDLRNLMALLDKVKRCALDAPNTLKSLVDVGSLSNKLHQVAELLDEKCNKDDNQYNTTVSAAPNLPSNTTIQFAPLSSSFSQENATVSTPPNFSQENATISVPPNLPDNDTTSTTPNLPDNVTASATLNLPPPDTVTASATLNLPVPGNVTASATLNLSAPDNFTASATLNLPAPDSVTASATLNLSDDSTVSATPDLPDNAPTTVSAAPILPDNATAISTCPPSGLSGLTPQSRPLTVYTEDPPTSTSHTNLYTSILTSNLPDPTDAGLHQNLSNDAEPHATSLETGRLQTPSSPPKLPFLKKRFSDQPPPTVDEATKKQRLNVEKMIKSLSKPKTHSCGVSYTGDEKEKKFSDGIKEDIKKKLPELKTNRLIFRYMAWTTQERLECSYCSQCTNEYPTDTTS